MSEQAVRFLTNLLGIYSPSGKEQDIANFMALEMKHMGFEVGIDAIGNVIGVVGKGRTRHIALWTHGHRRRSHARYALKKAKSTLEAQSTQKAP